MERAPYHCHKYLRKVVRLIRPILTWFPPFLFSLFSIRSSMNLRMYTLIISFVMATTFTSFHTCMPACTISLIRNPGLTALLLQQL